MAQAIQSQLLRSVRFAMLLAGVDSIASCAHQQHTDDGTFCEATTPCERAQEGLTCDLSVHGRGRGCESPNGSLLCIDSGNGCAHWAHAMRGPLPPPELIV